MNNMENYKNQIKILKYKCEKLEKELNENLIEIENKKINDNIEEIKNYNDNLRKEILNNEINYNNLLNNKENNIKEKEYNEKQNELNKINQENETLNYQITQLNQQCDLLKDKNYIYNQINFWTPVAMFKFIQAYDKQNK
jgi:predicted nuclease with TOPRIM domain